MALPATIRVKLSSEGAEAISITAVAQRDMPTREVVELMLGVTGKDAARVRELLLRGGFVSGAWRFRWLGVAAEIADIEALLACFPDAEPERPLEPSACVRAVLHGASGRVEILREAASRKRLLRKKSLWDVLLEAIAEGEPHYLEYSYKDRADRYRVRLPAAARQHLRANASVAAYTTLAGQIKTGDFEAVDLYVVRP